MKGVRLCLAAAALAVAAGGGTALAGPTPLVRIDEECYEPWTEIARVGNEAVCVWSEGTVAVYTNGSDCGYSTVELSVGDVTVCYRG